MIVRRVGELAAEQPRGGRFGRSDSTNVIVSLRTSSADYTLDGGRLTVMCAWRGREDAAFEGRRLAIDDDSWLALCPQTPIACRIAAEREMSSLTIVFRPGFAEDVLATLLLPDDRLLARSDHRSAGPLPFAPNLQAHDRTVTPVLTFIQRHCDMGVEDDLWYEEQLAFLLERLLTRHRQIIDRARAIPARRAGTRREIFRRIALATDFIHSSYERPLTLLDMANSACLSRHHFLRLFKSVHGLTPHEFLQRKRTLVAARLLRESDMAVEEIVQRVGFDSRSTLFRALRRFHGITPRECRRGTSTTLSALPSYAAITCGGC
jgi:AraC family transcriptional regulator